MAEERVATQGNDLAGACAMGDARSTGSRGQTKFSTNCYLRMAKFYSCYLVVVICTKFATSRKWKSVSF